MAAEPLRRGGRATRPGWPSHFWVGGSATLGEWLGPISGWPRQVASPFGGVARPDLGGGWPGGRRASHPPDRAQTTTYGAPVPILAPLRSSAAARRERFGVAAAAAATPEQSTLTRTHAHHTSRRGLFYLRRQAQGPQTDRPCMRFDKDAVSDGLERQILESISADVRTSSADSVSSIRRC